MKTFREWLKEMCGTDVVYDGTKSPDFQVWGAPWSATNAPRKKKRKAKKDEPR